MINRKSGVHKRKVLLGIKLVLILLLGHVIVRTAVTPQNVREGLVPNSAGGSEKVIPVEPATAPENAVADYSAILERGLFDSRVSAGPAEEAAPAENSVRSVLPDEDKLEIALIGTVAGSQAVSRAIIKDLETNVLGQYRTGDMVLTASIEKIERDRVVLIHRGQRKVLTLRSPESGPVAAESARVAAKAKVPQPVEVTKPPRPATTFGEKLRYAAMMLPEATVVPHSVRGEVEGLRITDLGNIGGVEDLGLKDGDVICAINGHRLNSKQKAFQIAMKARSQAALSVELMRDNKIKTFSLPLK